MDVVVEIPAALESFLFSIHKIVSDSSEPLTAAELLPLVDTLEIDVRQQCMERVVRSTRKDEDDSMQDDIYSFWYHILHGIFTIVRRIEGSSTGSKEATDLHMNGTSADEMEVSSIKNDHAADGFSFPNASAFWKLTDASWRQLHSILSPLRKIPVLLLEDITELLSIESAYRFWCRGVLQQPLGPTVSAKENGAPTSQSQLFSPVLWDLSKSPSQNSSIIPGPNPCWLPFLKTANKLIRRLQICGPLTIRMPRDGKVAVTASMAISEIVLLLSTIYPLTEKSATRAWGSYNEQHVTAMESEREYSQTLLTESASDSVNTTEPLSVSTQPSIYPDSTGTDFSFYQEFWMLQQDFRNPNGIIVSDFLRRLKLVLRTLQSQATRKSFMKAATLAPPEHRPLQEYVLLPFLTQSRILPIQLQDEAIRSVILMQICIVIHHLMIQVPQLRSQLQLHLSTISDDAFSAATRHYLSRISFVLDHSESFWRHWKQNKCLPDLEKQRTSKLESSVALRPRKRPRISSVSRGTHQNDDWIVGNDLQKVSKGMRTSNVPATQDYLQEYVEALDPEAGIEAEYHPKNDSVFTWRALRLFAFGSADNSEYLSEFHRISPQGDFENMVRHIYETDYKVSIPGEGLPLYENISDKEDDDENVNELAKSVDIMDDAIDEVTAENPDASDEQQISPNGPDEKEVIEESNKDIPLSNQKSEANTEKKDDIAMDVEPTTSEPEKVDDKAPVNGSGKANASKAIGVKKVAEESKPRSTQPKASESDNARNGNRGAVPQRSHDRNRPPGQHSREVGGADRGHDKYWPRDGGAGYVDGPVSRTRSDAPSRDGVRGHSREDMHRARDDYHRRGAGADSATSLNEPRRDDGEWRGSAVGPDYPHGRSNINSDRGRDMNRGGANSRARSGGGGWRSNEGSSSRR
jgi:THO complex subunit 1 transcription elongation factor